MALPDRMEEAFTSMARTYVLRRKVDKATLFSQTSNLEAL